MDHGARAGDLAGMIEGLFYGAGLWLTAMLSTTAVPSLIAPLCYAPLMLTTGLLVLHREGVVPGVAWLVLGAVLLGEPSLVLAAAVGAVLVVRVFAARSVYALLGLGVATGGVVAIAQGIGTTLRVLTGGTGGSLAPIAWRYVLLLALLYCGYVLVHVLRRTLLRLFVIRQHEY